MDKRFFLFIAISMAILIGSQAINAIFFPPKDKPVEQAGDNQVVDANDGAPPDADANAGGGQADHGKATSNEGGTASAADSNGDVSASDTDEPPPVADEGLPKLLTIGSLDPNSTSIPSRMLATFTSRGAALRRLELNSPRYLDMEDSKGYLGHLAGIDAPDGSGCLVRVVGPGTPADTAGLLPDDVIVQFNATPIATAKELNEAIKTTLPGDVVALTVERNGQPIKPLSATLARRPLEIMRPERGTEPKEALAPGLYDPFSILTTLSQIDEQQLLPDDDELEGVQLRDVNWDVTKSTPSEVQFERTLADAGLKVIKRYRLAELPADEIQDQDYKAYHLLVDLEVVNLRDTARKVAYRLDGPTGMPTEGWWYSRKISRTGDGSPLRDIAAHASIDGPNLINASHVATMFKDRKNTPVGLVQPGGKANQLAYVGVETQYFAAILIPGNRPKDQQRYKSYEGIVVGELPETEKLMRLSNVTSRLTSEPFEIEPNGRVVHSFQFFTGPKRRDLLEQYAAPEFPVEVNLSELIYYGWPIWALFAVPLTNVLHFFYGIIPNYGIAIILLTVMVRLCMFPLSRKQALNAQKMQELQPEIKQISEKYKGDMEKRSKALQDLYRKHKYNPLSGCAPLFIQLPIFIGLYRALMSDVELRQAPLISTTVGWCNNLSAPDMFWRWDALINIPAITSKAGLLGPYLNILPLVTVALFVVQQKMFMPPPTDDQAALQQKIMKYMMLLMGFFFFCVPSGLCIYFIASSLWGLGERKLLPKLQKPETTGASPVPVKAEKKQAAKTSKNGSGDKRVRKKQRNKK